MSETTHLLVEKGPELGRTIQVPAGGARLGRAEGNDLVLRDPSVSRFQCRFYFKDGRHLAVADLASTNETLVNERPIQDVRLQVGDRVDVGESTLTVTCDTLGPTQEPLRGGEARSPAEIDLGLDPAAMAPTGRPGSGRRGVRWAIAVLALLLVALAGLLAYRQARRGASPLPRTGREASERALLIDYEKVEASGENIFRYHLRLEDGMLRVQIDNLDDARHVNREERVPQEDIDELARWIEQAGFFALSEEYSGIAAGVWDQFDMEVNLDRRVHRVRVVNRLEPERFREVRGTIEDFARNWIGLHALALPPERLMELAREAWLQGQKLFDEREVRFENLARAIRAFSEVENFLETVEPKPDFFADAIAAREECRRLLQERYESYMFRAERAIRLRDWAEANANLRIVLELLQDRSDERYESAYRQLIDVQRRLDRQQRR